MPFLAKDPELLARFRRGEPAALEKVYWAYIDRLERVVRHGFLIARNEGVRVAGASGDEVADLLQETFARAFAERARLAYDGLRDYGPFLITIARNLLVDRARKSGRELPLDPLGLDVEGPAPEEPVADERTLKAVREYLSRLGPELRELHEQRYVRCVSQEEAARQLKLSRQQIRTLEKRLREGLERHLEAAGVPLEEEVQPKTPPVRMEGQRKAT